MFKGWSLKTRCFALSFACTKASCEHAIDTVIEHKQTILTSYTINLPKNRVASEGPETSVLELSTRRIPFCQVYFWLDIIWKVILRKEVRNMHHTKIDAADLDSPRRELSLRGLGFVVHTYPFRFFGNWFLCVRLPGFNPAVRSIVTWGWGVLVSAEKRSGRWLRLMVGAPFLISCINQT